MPKLDHAAIARSRSIASKDDAEGRRKIKAAQYVRMSTDAQKCSIEHQIVSIEAYADERGFEIVQSYVDAGRSGLTASGRPQLQRMINDVQSGVAEYSHILVYDVSRWGRFQDVDESAYYEYICKSTNIKVHYCAEPFTNDDSLTAALLKWMKRAMAGEYSRELSAKVFAAQANLIRQGYHMGGIPGYALQRYAVDSNSQIKAALQPGEQKFLQGERVILLPGPAQEVDVVRRIFRLFSIDGLKQTRIASALNVDGIPSCAGGPWNVHRVTHVLMNERYTGVLVYNKTSFRLHKTYVRNDPKLWIRSGRCFEPIIDLDTFSETQMIIKGRRRQLSDHGMLDRLRRLLREKKRLSYNIINKAHYIPTSPCFMARFGSLQDMYKLLGYVPPRNYLASEEVKRCRLQQRQLSEAATKLFADAGWAVAYHPRRRIIYLDHGPTVSVYLSRCIRLKWGRMGWILKGKRIYSTNFTIAARCSTGNTQIDEFFVLPAALFSGNKAYFTEDRRAEMDAFSHPTLAAAVDAVSVKLGTGYAESGRSVPPIPG